MAVFEQIAEEIRQTEQGVRAYRRFGLLFVVVLGGSGGYLAFSHMPTALLLLTASAIFATLTFLRPLVLRWPYSVWMALAVVLGFFVSRLLLAGVYYIIVTPIGLGGRILGKVFLERIDRKCDSYWVDRSQDRYTVRDSEKMY